MIFMSHQWTAFDEPDHTGLQYKGMVEAVDTVMQKNGWESQETSKRRRLLRLLLYLHHISSFFYIILLFPLNLRYLKCYT